MVDSHLTDPQVKKVACAPDGISQCYHGKQGLETLEEMLSTLPRVQVCSTLVWFYVILSKV